MTEIIPFRDTKDNQDRRSIATREEFVRGNQETPLEEIESQLGSLLSETPQGVQEIIDATYLSSIDISVVDPKKLKALIVDYIVFSLSQANISLETGGILFGVQYISDLLFKIYAFEGEEIKLVLEHPYFTHWMKEGYPKRAGDASVYSYMFRNFDGVPINREDYIGFAHSGYSEWSKQPELPTAVARVLPEIGGMMRDKNFLNRGTIREIR